MKTLLVGLLAGTLFGLHAHAEAQPAGFRADLPHVHLEPTINPTLAPGGKFADWILETKVYAPVSGGVVRQHEFSNINEGAVATISTFNADDLLRWMTEAHAAEILNGDLDLDRDALVVAGRAAFAWINHDNLLPGLQLVVAADAGIVEVAIAGATHAEIIDILGSVDLGNGTTVELPAELLERIPVAPMVASCCESDPYTNTYPCCSPSTGNCTFAAERDAVGSNNFSFGGPGMGNRNAHAWMSRAWEYNRSRNAQGGTIPQVGAVAVFSTAIGPAGHVATVTGVGADGGITVSEQNCDRTCTRSWSYSQQTLRDRLAGFIYRTTTPPSPTPKAILGDFIGRQTVIEDINWGRNVYNFSARGPGHVQSSNGNERAWGLMGAGASGSNCHYTRTRTGESENTGTWYFNILVAGTYKIEAYIPNNSAAGATRARYRVGNGLFGTFSSPVNQTTTRGTWVQIRNPNSTDGNWELSTGSSGKSVILADNYAGNAPESGVNLAMDALRFTRVR